MRIWYIVKTNEGPMITYAHQGSLLNRKLLEGLTIGPYWSHIEARKVYNRWTK